MYFCESAFGLSKKVQLFQSVLWIAFLLLQYLIWLSHFLSTRFNNILFSFSLFVLSVKKAIELKSRGVKMLPSKDSNHKNSVCKLFLSLSLVWTYIFRALMNIQKEKHWEAVVIKWLFSYQMSMNLELCW